MVLAHSPCTIQGYEVSSNSQGLMLASDLIVACCCWFCYDYEVSSLGTVTVVTLLLLEMVS